MEQTTSSRDLINLFVPLFLVLAPILFLVIKKFTSSRTIKALPPGPRPWPILGNLLQVGTRPHISLTHFAQLHGPLISLKLGTQLVVVGSSPAAAAEILKTHDALLSARSRPEVLHVEGLDYKQLSLVWQDSNDRWRFLRNLCKTELLSGKALESTSMIREKKMKEMVEFLGTKQGQVVKIAQVVSVTIYNSMTNLFFSKDFRNYGDAGPGRLKENLLLAEKNLAYAGNIADFYPIFARFDLQGLKKEGLEFRKNLSAIWGDIIKKRRENSHLDTREQRDFLDVLLAKGFSNDQIDYLAAEILSGGTDTTTTTVEWAMVELIKNKEAMRKVEEELTRGIKTKDSIKESDLSQLPYLLACVMETLRLHPPVPLLLPHRAIETCQVMNYTIPKDTRVLVNVYAIGRDPAAWEDPLSFKPQRFLDSKNYLKGLDFGYIPFGSGRRMCPGQSLGIKQVALFLAHLVHCFDWCLPNNEDPVHLDMSEKLIITLQKEQPLCLIPKKKL